MTVLAVPVPEAGQLHLFGLHGAAMPGSPVVQAGPGIFADLDLDGQRELITLLPDGTLKCLPPPDGPVN